jgi:hypothetical protein
MPIGAKGWYQTEFDLTSFYQGDIVRDVPIIFLPDKISKWFVLRPGPNSKKHVDDVLRGEICKWFEATPEGQLRDAWQHGEKEELVAAKAFRADAIILTQTCDLENRSYYQVAPVYPATRQKASSLEVLRENGINSAFYLPALAPHIVENSYAELSHTCVVPKAYFVKNAVVQMLSARLSDYARTELQAHIAHYFGRPFGFGPRDRASVAGQYSCVSCFYRFGEAVKTEFQAGSNFTPCEKCNATLWIRTRTVIQTAGESQELP